MGLTLTHFLLYLPVLWFAARLARHPRDPALRAVVAFFLLGLVDVPGVLSLQAGLGVPDEVVRLLRNLALVAACLCLQLFFVFAAGYRWRRAWRETAVCATVASAMTVCVTLRPAAFAPPAPLAQSPRLGTIIVFFALGNVYYAYVTGSAAIYAWLYARESPRRARPGLWCACLGLAVFAALSLVRAGDSLPISLPRTLADALTPALKAAILLFVVGVCLTGAAGRIAALRVWRHHRRVHEELRPLWTALHAAYPEAALDRPTSRWLDPLLVWRVHRRYWRRVIEIRDGLVDLSVHLRDVGFRPEQPAHEQIGGFRAALRRKHAGETPSSSVAVAVAVPDYDTEGNDVDQLVQLSRALRATPPEDAATATAAGTP